MTKQLLAAAAVSLCNIAVHALVMTSVIRAARALGNRPIAHPSLFLISTMTITVSFLMAAHVCEVMLWAASYVVLDVAPANVSRVYFAFVNYTTLGYGDVLPSQEWQLLGPITAMNGVLLFGWSTAVIFEVMRKALLRGAPSAYAGQLRSSA